MPLGFGVALLTYRLLEAVERLKPDAVVVDIRMPPNHTTEGIHAARQIRASHPSTGVVVLSQYANALYAFELFQEGTAGLAYLLKDRVGDISQLLGAIDAVTQGESVIDRQVVESLLAVGGTVTHSGIDDLTSREKDVIREMAQGKSNQAIAETLHISGSAVEKHISSILAKLQLDPADSSINQRVAAVLSFLRGYNPGAG